MIEARSTIETIIPATSGYNIFYFAPDPSQKPSASLIKELVQANSFPVTCWRLRGNVTEPLTFKDAPPNAQSFIFTPGRIYALDSDLSWPNYDAFAGWLFCTWRVSRNLAPVEPPSRPSGTLYEIAPGTTQAILPTAGFHS